MADREYSGQYYQPRSLDSPIADRSRLATLISVRKAPPPPPGSMDVVVAHSRGRTKSVPRPPLQIPPQPQRLAASATGPSKDLSPAPAYNPRPSIGNQFTPPKSAPSRRFIKNFFAPHKLLAGLGFAVFGMALLINMQTLQTNHSAHSQVAALAQKSDSSTNDSASGSVPSETRPNGIGNYAVAPNLPKYIKIAKLGVNARVMPLGVTGNNELKAPSNIYDTGWYDASAHPGDSGSLGAVLIDGHVHGPTLPGVFMNIKKLLPGDTIQVVRGDNNILSYKVIKVQNYDVKTLNMGMLLASIRPGEPGLNLITCGGPFDRQADEYTQRTVVFSVQVP